MSSSLLGFTTISALLAAVYTAQLAAPGPYLRRIRDNSNNNYQDWHQYYHGEGEQQGQQAANQDYGRPSADEWGNHGVPAPGAYQTVHAVDAYGVPIAANHASGGMVKPKGGLITRRKRDNNSDNKSGDNSDNSNSNRNNNNNSNGKSNSNGNNNGNQYYNGQGQEYANQDYGRGSAQEWNNHGLPPGAWQAGHGVEGYAVPGTVNGVSGGKVKTHSVTG